VCLAQVGNAQRAEIDSLQTVLYAQDEPQEQINALIKLSFSYPDSANTHRMIEQALEIARTNDLPKALADVTYQKASAHIDHGDFEAELYLNEALRLSENATYNMGIANAYYGWGRFHYHGSNYAESIRYFEKALKRYRAENATSAVYETVNHIARAYGGVGDYLKALDSYMLAVEISDGNELSRDPTSLNHIGSVYLCMNQFSEAESYFARAHSLLAKQEKNPMKARLNLNRATTSFHLDSGSAFLEALELSSNALVTFNASNDVEGAADSYKLLGDIYLRQNSYDSALYFYSQALGKVKNRNFVRAQQEAKIGYGKYLICMDSLQKARAVLEESLVASNEKKIILETLNALYTLEKRRTGKYSYQSTVSLIEGDSTGISSAADRQSGVEFIKTPVEPTGVIIERLEEDIQPQKGYLIVTIILGLAFLSMGFLFFRRFRREGVKSSAGSTKHSG